MGGPYAVALGVAEVDGDRVAVGDRPELGDVLPALEGDVDPLELGEGVGEERDLVDRAEAQVGRTTRHHDDLMVLRRRQIHNVNRPG